MSPASFRLRRSVLYLPASNARAIEKARTLPCDAVILDLEDAVAPAMKPLAREQAAAAVLAGGWGHREVVVRVNGLETEWGEADLAAAVAAGPDAILVPKVSDAASLRAYDGAICAAPEHTRLWAMIETAAAVVNLADITRAAADTRLSALVLGLNDLAKELRAPLQPGREAFRYAMAAAVSAGRAQALTVIDGVFNDLDDAVSFEAECRQAAEFGFDGKTLIHPSQVEPCTRAFRPQEADVALARAVVEAFASAENRDRAAIRVAGKMVERLHLDEARRVLESATR